MSPVEITIDNQKVLAREGDQVLWAALEAGIYIPHLCADRELDHHPGSCRLCFVEIEGIPEPVPACTITVKPGMVVLTRTERVDRLFRSAFSLLMSHHRVDCADCPANGKCALQEISRKKSIPLKARRITWSLTWETGAARPAAEVTRAKFLLNRIEPDYPVDESRDDFGLNPNHCVLCGKCVKVCNQKKGRGILDFIQRGIETRISTFDKEPLSKQECDGCLSCVNVCPVGALYLIEKD